VLFKRTGVKTHILEVARKISRRTRGKCEHHSGVGGAHLLALKLKILE